ncbi:MAG: hypothetical protein E6K69_01510 [Nitrospirae bacterium]|nr:MAG: hypothetical protein E6K69_01510 [Nitrospirota bacterium]
MSVSHIYEDRERIASPCRLGHEEPAEQPIGRFRGIGRNASVAKREVPDCVLVVIEPPDEFEGRATGPRKE